MKKNQSKRPFKKEKIKKLRKDKEGIIRTVSRFDCSSRISTKNKKACFFESFSSSGGWLCLSFLFNHQAESSMELTAWEDTVFQCECVKISYLH